MAAALISLFSFFPRCSRAFLRTVLVYTSLDPFAFHNRQRHGTPLYQEVPELAHAAGSSRTSEQQETEEDDSCCPASSNVTGGKEAAARASAPPLLACPYRISLGFLFARFSHEAAQVLLQPLLGEGDATSFSSQRVGDGYLLALQHLMQMQHTRSLRYVLSTQWTSSRGSTPCVLT